MINQYASYETSAVIQFIDNNVDAMPGDTYCEAIDESRIAEWDQEDGALALVWSVYGRDSEGLAHCLCDCPDQDSANDIAEALNAHA